MPVPLHWSADGLPIGVMFSARFGEDAILLRLAAQLEKTKPGGGERPKMIESGFFLGVGRREVRFCDLTQSYEDCKRSAPPESPNRGGWGSFTPAYRLASGALLRRIPQP